MHDLEFDHEHEAALDEAVQLAIAEAIWEQETVDLLTVGIDIGSSTTHLLFARVILRREQHDLSSRFRVVERRIIWRSPIRLTPFRPDGTIDAHELRHFFGHCYEDAGYKRADVDTGAVILTGEAIKKVNARAINEIFAGESGRFVCATAGHRLEATLAAQGSGAVTLSQERGCGLHVDIGGGTTKLALVRDGEVLDVAAFAVGGRLIAQDKDGVWSRIDDSARLLAQDLGIAATPEAMADQDNRNRIAHRMAGLVMDQIRGEGLDALGQSLLLTAPLRRDCSPNFISFSGGVSEYIFGYETADFGDIARMLAGEIVDQLRQQSDAVIIDAGQRIRATVIGASQFTVQVSGKTLYLTREEALPQRNVPVVRLSGDLPDVIIADDVASALRHAAAMQDLALSGAIALAFTWSGIPDYARLRALAEGLVLAALGDGPRDGLLAVVIDGDVGLSIGRILREELGFDGDLVCLDGIQLKDLDFVDIGSLMEPPGVIPLVIKSLLFS
ncbi:ethanolamine ammonia-lyase reactivating factor EutA [Paracoccus sp. (in: a-proteobacteria)]|uniref:ethanolamine ammonia-lyase reactivating factor EutA n=1 Tax=Paracoccus sp. TaxID=267 RepID=UPI00289C4550|nr:ethanolamine ammonia-lyase reactivating factor EutA [Paracoccus sp. (in: a-proteobacteria)]